MSKVVKVNQATIRNRYLIFCLKCEAVHVTLILLRLLDFKDTPSSRLTIEDFLQINLEQEHDPPSYSEARKKPKLTTNNEPEVCTYVRTPQVPICNNRLVCARIFVLLLLLLGALVG